MNGWLLVAVRALKGAAWIGTVTSGIYCALVVIAAQRFRSRQRLALRAASAAAPAVSLLKPLHGREPGLAANLRSFFQQSYPGQYELLFCARQSDDAGLELAREIGAEYPAVTSRIVLCGEPLYANPKMYSLAVMTAEAAYDILLTSDADARVSPDYITQLVAELEPPRMELASCIYRGITEPGASLMLRLDALGKSVEMGSGVLIADMLGGGADFALGVTMVLRRGTWALAGGTADLGTYWAEDFVLGNRLAAAGHGVAISTHVIDLVVTADSDLHSWRNQLRWMQSTRRSRPWGHLGTGLTFAMPFGLLGCLAEMLLGHPRAAIAFLGAAVLNRLIESIAMLTALHAPGIVLGALLYPLRDLLGSFVWLASYLPADSRYHGTHFRIMPDGRLQPAPPA